MIDLESVGKIAMTAFVSSGVVGFIFKEMFKAQLTKHSYKLQQDHKLELDKKFADYEMRISKIIEDHKTFNEKYLHENKEVFNQKFLKIQELPMIFDEVQDVVVEIISIINDEETVNLEELKHKENSFVTKRKNAKTICSSSIGFISDDMYAICQDTEQHFDKIIKNLKMYIRCVDKSSNIVTSKIKESEKFDTYEVDFKFPTFEPFAICELCAICELKESDCDAFVEEELNEETSGTTLCIKKITKTINSEIDTIKNLIEEIHTKKKEFVQKLEEKNNGQT